MSEKNIDYLSQNAFSKLASQKKYQIVTCLDNFVGDLRNTCFMNSVLQALVNIPELTLYFLSKQYDKDKKVSDGMADAYRDLLLNVNDPKARYENLVKINRAFAKVCKGYKIGSQYDAYFFLLYFLRYAPEEVNNPKLNKDELKILKEKLDKESNLDKKIEIKKQIFESEINLFLLRLLYFYQSNAHYCSECNNCINSCVTKNSILVGDFESLDDMLKNLSQDKLVDGGKDKDFCKTCNKEVSYYSRSRIYGAPNYFFVRRVKNGEHEKFYFKADDFSIGEFAAEKDDQDAKYELTSIVCKSGDKDSGHCYSCCYKFDNVWYYFSDNILKKMPDDYKIDQDEDIQKNFFLGVYRKKDMRDKDLFEGYDIKDFVHDEEDLKIISECDKNNTPPDNEKNNFNDKSDEEIIMSQENLRLIKDLDGLKKYFDNAINKNIRLSEDDFISLLKHVSELKIKLDFEEIHKLCLLAPDYFSFMFNNGKDKLIELQSYFDSICDFCTQDKNFGVKEFLSKLDKIKLDIAHVKMLIFLLGPQEDVSVIDNDFIDRLPDGPDDEFVLFLSFFVNLEYIFKGDANTDKFKFDWYKKIINDLFERLKGKVPAYLNRLGIDKRYDASNNVAEDQSNLSKSEVQKNDQDKTDLHDNNTAKLNKKDEKLDQTNQTETESKIFDKIRERETNNDNKSEEARENQNQNKKTESKFNNLDDLLKVEIKISELEKSFLEIKAEDRKNIATQAKDNLEKIFEEGKSDMKIFKELGNNEDKIDLALNKIKKELIICIMSSNLLQDEKSNYVELVKNANKISFLRCILQTIKNIVMGKFSEVGKAKQSVALERISDIKNCIDIKNQREF